MEAAPPNGAHRLAGPIALAIFAAGIAAMANRITLRRSRAEIGDLSMAIERTDWLEHDMDHGDVFPVPSSMIEGMPPKSVHRLNVEVSVRNAGRSRERFEIRELFLHSTRGNVWPASGGEVHTIDLARHQEAHLIVDFDVSDSDRGDLRIVWERMGTTRKMTAISHPRDHLSGRVEGPPRWPEDVAGLPPGAPGRGERIYERKFACWSCHGRMGDEGSATVGPHLGAIGEVARTRVRGKSARQYLYESLLHPDAFIAPACGKTACAVPSAMPPWGDLLTPVEMADLIAYLEERTWGAGVR